MSSVGKYLDEFIKIKTVSSAVSGTQFDGHGN